MQSEQEVQALIEEERLLDLELQRLDEEQKAVDLEVAELAKYKQKIEADERSYWDNFNKYEKNLKLQQDNREHMH